MTRTSGGEPSGRGSFTTTVELWALGILVPFVIIAVRAVAYRGHIYLFGDWAVNDVQVHQAMRWQELLGVRGRFGWHHPGPFFLYLVAFVEHIAGPSNGAQAQIATAALIVGVSLAGIVYVTGKLGGFPVTAAVVVALVIAVILLSGSLTPLDYAWTPYVVVVPVAFMGILCLAAGLGSGTALAAAVLVGSFVVQTDVSTAPVAVVFVAAGAATWWFRRRRRVRAVPGGPSAISRGRAWLPGVAILTAAVASWIPPVYQEFTGAQGNLSAIVQFFTHAHAHAGIALGAALTGLEEASVVGVTQVALVGSKTAGLLYLVIAVATTALFVTVALRTRDRLVLGGVLLFGGGTAVSVVSGAGIVGKPAPYLVAWAGGVAAVGLVTFAVVIAHWTAPRGTRRRDVIANRAWKIVGLAGLGGLVVWAVAQPAPASTSVPQVGAVYRTIAPLVEAHPNARIGISYEGFLLAPGVAAGVIDELDDRGLKFSVPKGEVSWFTPANGRSASLWILFVGPHWHIPDGYREIPDAGGLHIGYATTKPPRF